MDVQKIEDEINKFKSHLSFLENCLKEIQQNCEHHFCKENQDYEKCTKCHKVNVLYY